MLILPTWCITDKLKQTHALELTCILKPIKPSVVLNRVAKATTGKHSSRMHTAAWKLYLLFSLATTKYRSQGVPGPKSMAGRGVCTWTWVMVT